MIILFLTLWIASSLLLGRAFRRWVASEPLMFDLPLPLLVWVGIWIVGAIPASIVTSLVFLLV